VTDLTSISTFGWYSGDGFESDLLTAVSTFGWYGVTAEQLVEVFQTVDFGLIIDQLNEIGLEIEGVEHQLALEITRDYEKGLNIDRVFNIRLKR
jgi:hypothetical protein